MFVTYVILKLIWYSQFYNFKGYKRCARDKSHLMKDRNVKGTGTFGKRSYLVSVVPLFTICRMNDLRSEFNSWNPVYNASRFTALKMSGIVLYCWWKSFIWLKLSESLLQPTLVVINLTKQNIPAFDFKTLVFIAVLSASAS